VPIADENGEPTVLQNAICLHEEDHGVLWKHTDMFNGWPRPAAQDDSFSPFS
jgi:primary-amine oxidase